MRINEIRPTLSGDVPRGYAFSSITSLTCTLFDPGHIGWFGEKCLCFILAQRARILASWYIFPNRVLKLAHRPSRCVTGLKDGELEPLVGIGLVYPPCFARKSRESAEYCGWIKGFPCQKPENALKPLVLVKSALAGGISFSDMQEKVIQKTGASSITNLGLATRQFSHFQR